MKRQLMTVLMCLSYVVTLAASSANAQSKQGLTIDVPFSFIVDGKTLEPGQYKIERLNSGMPAMFVLKTADGRKVKAFWTSRVEVMKPEKEGKLVFLRYGENWSRDGRKLAGILRGPESLNSRLISYDLDSQQIEQLTDFGTRPSWLSDSRRIIFSHEDKIYLLDTQTKKRSQILSVAPHRLQSVATSKDDRSIYYSLATTEADVWLMSFN
jgi:Tol biopolymer transport system component